MTSAGIEGRTLLATIEDDCCPLGEDLISRDEATRVATLFKALSDPVRVQLLRHIAGAEHGTACACHLPGALGISQPTLSHHLRKLTDAGLVTILRGMAVPSRPNSPSRASTSCERET